MQCIHPRSAHTYASNCVRTHTSTRPRTRQRSQLPLTTRTCTHPCLYPPLTFTTKPVHTHASARLCPCSQPRVPAHSLGPCALTRPMCAGQIAYAHKHACPLPSPLASSQLRVAPHAAQYAHSNCTAACAASRPHSSQSQSAPCALQLAPPHARAP